VSAPEYVCVPLSR